MAISDVAEASDKLRKVHQEMTQWENSKVSLEKKLVDLQKQCETVQKQIEQKTADAQIFIAGKHNDIAKAREALEEERKKLGFAKEELASQVKALQTEKGEVEKRREEAIRSERIAKDMRSKIDQFVIATQRAYSLIGG